MSRIRRTPSDAALPSLQDLFPTAGAPGFVADVARQATGSPVDADLGKLRYARYRPARDCVALWSFPSESSRPLLVSGKLYSDRSGAPSADLSSLQRLAEQAEPLAGGNAIPYRYLPDQPLLLQVFPLDAELPGLALAASNAWMSDALARHSGTSPDDLPLEASIVVYKPWHRSVLRYVGEGPEGRVDYFAKVLRDDRGHLLAERLRTLKAQLAGLDSPWEVPEPIAYLPEARTLVLRALGSDGEVKALVKQALDNPLARQTLRQCIPKVAEGLASLQAATIDGLPVVDPPKLLTKLRLKTACLRRVERTLASSIEAMLDRLQAAAERLPAEEMVLSHGAFRHTQILLSGDRLGLIDLDDVRLSGKSSDAGEFLAALDRLAVRRPRLRPVAQEVAGAFLAALHGSLALDLRWLAWYRALADVKNGAHSLFALSPRWPERAEGLIRLAGETLNEAGL